MADSSLVPDFLSSSLKRVNESFYEFSVATLKWAAEDPYDFLFSVLVCMTPLFMISAFLSYKLSKAIDRENAKKLKNASSKAAKKRSKAKQS